MIPDSQTDLIYFSELLKSDLRFSATCKQITDVLDSYDVIYKFLPSTKDIWCRDYMPIQISVSRFIEYRYDPDYLQGTYKGLRDSKTYPDMVCSAISLKTEKSNVILDGGNIVKSKNCVILTEKIVKENRLSYTKTALIKRLLSLFEVENIVMIPWYRKERYGHSDGVLRFINDHTVLISELYESDSIMLKRLKKAGLNYEFLRLKAKKRHKYHWAYINFLQTKDLILIPEFNLEEDAQALSEIKRHYPDYACNDSIAQIDMSGIVQYNGALNCISWTMKQ